MTDRKVTDHRDGDEHTRTITYTHNDGSQRIVEQVVTDSMLGEVSARNTSETNIDSSGNSRTR